MWLLLASRMFAKDSDIARWWRETKSSIKTWDAFKTAFVNYEESGQGKDDRLTPNFLLNGNQSVRHLKPSHRMLMEFIGK
jgi:hypothetical protein